MQFAYPFHIDRNGRTAQANDNDHIRQMIEQVLFTVPGERVNRPTFGTGLNQLVFAPLSDELVTATQVLVQGALQQWLGDLINIGSVEVLAQESTLQVTVRYSVRSTGEAQTETFNRVV
jgi:phage baseplate assembly protein W